MTDNDGTTALIVILIAVPIAMLTGLVIKIMWGWYIVPLGVQQISVAHAYGLAILTRILSPHAFSKKDEPLTSMLGGIAILAVGLFLGWAGTWFM